MQITFSHPGDLEVERRTRRKVKTMKAFTIRRQNQNFSDNFAWSDCKLTRIGRSWRKLVQLKADCNFVTLWKLFSFLNRHLQARRKPHPKCLFKFSHCRGIQRMKRFISNSSPMNLNNFAPSRRHEELLCGRRKSFSFHISSLRCFVCL